MAPGVRVAGGHAVISTSLVRHPAYGTGARANATTASPQAISTQGTSKTSENEEERVNWGGRVTRPMAAAAGQWIHGSDSTPASVIHQITKRADADPRIRRSISQIRAVTATPCQHAFSSAS